MLYHSPADVAPLKLRPALEQSSAVLKVTLLSFQNGLNKTYGTDATNKNVGGALRVDP